LDAWSGWHSDLLAALVAALGFLCRAWLAHATFFNPDEAWHFSVANQDSLRQAYQASLTLFHPPLLIFVLYFWKSLGTSDLMLRLPCVIAGAVFCWLYYMWLKTILGRTVAWVGLVFMTFLPTMIGLSADLRQYSLVLMFSAAGAYFLERAFEKNSPGVMLLSSGSLLLAMLSHYSGFLFAATVGIYAILRMVAPRPSPGVVVAWITGQVAGLGLAWFLYITHIKKLATGYPGTQNLRHVADWYLPQFYYHPGRDHLLPFLFRGTFGVLRFAFAWVVVGHIATLLFVAGVILLMRRQSPSADAQPARLIGILLLCPFVLNWAAVGAGLYPYGRTRQCVFLAMFGIAGVSIAVKQIARQKTGLALAMAIGIVILCQLFGTPPSRDDLPLADRRREHMDQALEFIRRNVSPADVIYVNRSTEFQLAHYLCEQKPVVADRSSAWFESFQCNGLRIVSGEVMPDTLSHKWQELARVYSLRPATRVWVVEGGWTSGFAEALRDRSPEFSGIEIHSFGRYLEIFSLKVG
jgi:dolichyl-phosphate-mannose-protein mannosyltransferase